MVAAVVEPCNHRLNGERCKQSWARTTLNCGWRWAYLLWVQPSSWPYLSTRKEMARTSQTNPTQINHDYSQRTISQLS